MSVNSFLDNIDTSYHLFMFSAPSADPFSMAPQKAIETIGRTLNQQYERWQPRVRKILCFKPLHRLIPLRIYLCIILAKNEIEWKRRF